MIRNLLASTAIATLLATGAYAQTTTAPATDNMQMQTDAPQVKHAEGHLASNLIGENVYNGTGEDAENIGEVTDLVVSPEGNVEAIVVGVGGFLGIGQKAVALEYSLVQWHEQEGDEYIVVETTREALEAQEEFDVAAYEPMPADAEVGNTEPATAEDLGAPAPEEETAEAPADDAAQTEQDTAAAPAEEGAEAEQDTAAAPAEEGAEAEQDTAAAPADDAAQTEQDTAAAPAEEGAEAEQDMAADDAAQTEQSEQDTAAAPAEEGAEADQMETAAIDRSTLTEVDMSAGISAEDFIGTTVYGANEETIGEIGDIILTEDGSLDAIIVDVGGFLGMGEKPVAISMEQLTFMQDEGQNYYLYTSFTQEQLEAQPAYDEATFAEARDEQLLITE